ncbi:MAG: LamG domain-containing protein [Victivallales bacterium]|jgi:hypothetical protein|nr:LamG domain-containing protein [Victivallales bacterium]
MKNLFLVAAIIGAALTVTAADVTEVKPVSKTGISFAEGKIGKAARFNDKSRLYFDSKYLNTAGGAVEMWVCPSAETPANKQNFLISNGTNNPTWFFWGFDATKTNFLSRSKLPDQKFAHYSSISIGQNFPVDEWTHVALNWCNIEPSGSLVQLFVNGKVVIEKFDQTLSDGNDPKASSFGIGCNTSSTANPGFVGLIDELRVYNQPLSPKTIAENYNTVLGGKTLPCGDTVSLQLSFEDTLNGQSGASMLPLKELQDKGNAILDEIVEE